MEKVNAFESCEYNLEVSIGNILSVEFIRIQGGKAIQEDVVHVYDKDSKEPIIAALFDGNGGIGENSIRNDLLTKLLEYSNQNVTEHQQDDLQKIQNIFRETNNTLQHIVQVNEYEYEIAPWNNAGSTALLLFYSLTRKKFILAWCGDSEAIWPENNLLRSTKPVHHLMKRVGPYSFYRSFGNFDANAAGSSFLKAYPNGMTAQPDIAEIDPCGTKWILMATDGLWTYTTQQDVFVFINKLLEGRNNGFSDTVKDTYSDILKKVLILSILNDVQNNLIDKWFQFFFKEYARIIYSTLRLAKVMKKSYIKNLQEKVQTFNQFMRAVQFVLDDLPFLINPIQELQIRTYFKNKKNFMPSTNAIEEQVFPLLNDIELEAQNKQITKENLNNMFSIIIYLYSHLDDGTLSERLKDVFELDFSNIEIDENDVNVSFFYWHLAFLKDIQASFQKTFEIITNIKDHRVLYWHPDNLDKIINDIQCFASDNTTILFLNIENEIAKAAQSQSKELTLLEQLSGQSEAEKTAQPKNDEQSTRNQPTEPTLPGQAPGQSEAEKTVQPKNDGQSTINQSPKDQPGWISTIFSHIAYSFLYIWRFISDVLF
jgi:serine/threonine protein phosphatase PrpC